MKKIKILLALVTSIVIAGSSLAQVKSESRNLYFGIGVHQSKFQENVLDKVSKVNKVMKYESTNYKVLIGKRINNHWSIEGQYANFAKKNPTWGGALIPKLRFSGKSLGVAGLWHLDSQATYSPFVKLGMHFWDFKAHINAPVKLSSDGTDAFYGFGVDGKINQTMKYRIEFERFKADDGDLDNIGIGLLFDF